MVKKKVAKAELTATDKKEDPSEEEEEPVIEISYDEKVAKLTADNLAEV